MEQLSTKVNNITVSYSSKLSDEVEVTIVFIHGFPFNKTIWDKQLKSLPNNIRGIAYDIRGFGNSSTDHFFLNIDLFATDLLNFIDSLKIEKCVLCGISMGGYIALRTFELNSNKIAGLVLCDTNCIADKNEGKVKRFASIELIRSGGKDEFTEGFIKNVFSEDTLAHNPDVVGFLREVIKSTSDDTICSTQLAMASRTDTSSVLPNIKVPALIIRGENDKLMTDEQANQLNSGIAKSESITISKAGHLPNLENPEDFNKALNTFLHKHFL